MWPRPAFRAVPLVHLRNILEQARKAAAWAEALWSNPDCSSSRLLGQPRRLNNQLFVSMQCHTTLRCIKARAPKAPCCQGAHDHGVQTRSLLQPAYVVCDLRSYEKRPMQRSAGRFSVLAAAQRSPSSASGSLVVASNFDDNNLN